MRLRSRSRKVEADASLGQTSLGEGHEVHARCRRNAARFARTRTAIQYYLHKHHPLGGNTGTQYLIIKAQDDIKENTPIKLSERNKYYYSDHPLEIKLDLRWKKELNKDLKKLFEIKAGSLNESFRWDD